MYSKIKIMGHPIHPMLVAFPIAFYTSAFVAFLVFQLGAHDPFWFQVAYVANWAGVVTAVVASLPGFLDWALGIPNEAPAKKTGLVHMALNVTALLAFIVNLFVIRQGPTSWPESVWTSIGLTGFGFLLTMGGGFWGWKLIGEHKVGVSLSVEQERLEKAQTTTVPLPLVRDSSIRSAG